MASDLWGSDRNFLLLRKMTTSGAELFYFYIEEDNPRDLATDDSCLWLAMSEGRLKKYTMDGVIVDSIVGLFTSAWGITWENNYLWVSDPVYDSIYQVRLPQYENIIPDSVKNWIDSGANLVILDVREPYEFESYGRIHHALNMPWNSGVLDTAYTQLSLESGVKVEFDGYYSLDVYGNLLAQGTLSSNIHFTSLSSPAIEWRGIKIFEGSNTSFDYCRIDSSENGIHCLNSSPAIENSWISGSQTSIYLSGSNAIPEILNCVLQESSSILIFCDSSSAPVITYSSIMDGLKGVVARNDANPKLNYNNIYNNSEYGVLNEDSSIIIDAQYNWWGDKSGPYDPMDNPDGQGNRVSQWVDYIPWLQIESPYICGDVNSDTTVSVSDAVYLINYLFKGGTPPGC